MDEIKRMALVAGTLIGGIAAKMTGGWTGGMTALLICMAIDWATGTYLAWCQRSPKSEHGGLSSKAGARGLAKKGFTLLFVIVAHQMDIVAGTNIFRDAMVTGFFVNELVSIAENAGAMNIRLPDTFGKAMDFIQSKLDGEPNGGHADGKH